MAKKLDSLSIGLQRVTRTNDSLNKELYYYRAKDDFYVMAVDRQGSHFEWLLGIAIAVAGFFSYNYFNRRIQKVSDKWNKQYLKSKDAILSLEENLTKERRLFYLEIAFMYNNSVEKDSPKNGNFKELVASITILMGAVHYLMLAFSLDVKSKSKKLPTERLLLVIHNLQTITFSLEHLALTSPEGVQYRQKFTVEQNWIFKKLDDVIVANIPIVSTKTYNIKEALLRIRLEQ
ncbi:hypothetical protein GCM10027577_28710 [Spirosoma fluminis]